MKVSRCGTPAAYSITRVLVIGGTGMIGRPVVRALGLKGFQVAVGSRNRRKAQRIFSDNYPVVEVDLSDFESTTERLRGFDAVHLNLPSGPTDEDCFKNEFRAAKTAAAAAREAGIKRLSYLSGTEVSAEHGFPPSRAKWLAEEAIRESGIDCTIWRATWFMESLQKMVKFGLAVTIGKGAVRPHWLAGKDFGRMVAESMNNAEVAGKTFYVFGPEPVSLKDALKTYCRIRHPHAVRLAAPMRAMSLMGRLFSADIGFGVRMLEFLSRQGESGDVSLTDGIFGRPPTTIAEFARRLND